MATPAEHPHHTSSHRNPRDRPPITGATAALCAILAAVIAAIVGYHQAGLLPFP